MSYPPPGNQDQPPQYPTNQPPQQPQSPQQPYGGGSSGGYSYPPAPPTPSGDYGYGGSGYEAHMERPGTVTAAAIITMVMSVVGLIGAGILAAFFGPMWGSIEDNPSDYGMSSSEVAEYGESHAAIAGVCVTLGVLAIIAIVLAVFVMRGSNGARITLVVIGSITGLA
ncbi:MAG: hypothetical protein ACRDO7_14795, partial [Nocardioidaceae bacterium]